MDAQESFEWGEDGGEIHGINKQCGFFQSCLLFQYFLRDRTTQEASNTCLCYSCPLDKMRLFISLSISILSGQKIKLFFKLAIYSLNLHLLPGGDGKISV